MLKQLNIFHTLIMPIKICSRKIWPKISRNTCKNFFVKKFTFFRLCRHRILKKCEFPDEKFFLSSLRDHP
eukprot:UN24941